MPFAPLALCKPLSDSASHKSASKQTRFQADLWLGPEPAPLAGKTMAAIGS